MTDNSEAFQIALKLFNEERFFEAHESFEHIWKSEETPDEDRDFWKGITQIAVGFCHVQRGNAEGAVSLLQRAAHYLEGYPPVHQRVDTQRLLAAARHAAAEIKTRGTTAGRAFPRFPLADLPKE